MKELNTYIIEKLHLNKNIKFESDIVENISNYVKDGLKNSEFKENDLLFSFDSNREAIYIRIMKNNSKDRVSRLSDLVTKILKGDNTYKSCYVGIRYLQGKEAVEIGYDSIISIDEKLKLNKDIELTDESEFNVGDKCLRVYDYGDFIVIGVVYIDKNEYGKLGYHFFTGDRQHEITNLPYEVKKHGLFITNNMMVPQFVLNKQNGLEVLDKIKKDTFHRFTFNSLLSKRGKPTVVKENGISEITDKKLDELSKELKED